MDEKSAWRWAWVLAAGVALIFMYGYWNIYPIDFSALYFAADFYAEGRAEMVYPNSERFFWDEPPAEWKARAMSAGELFGSEPRHFPVYVYPPVWVAVLAPITDMFDFRIASNAMVVINVAAIAFMLILSIKIMMPKQINPAVWAGVAVVLVANSAIFHIALNLGQPQIVISAIVVFSFYHLSRGRDIQAGAWLALAAAIKVAPVIFVLIFVMEKRWRALGAFVVIGGALGIWSILMTGWPMHEVFLHRLGIVEGQILLSRINLGLDQILLQFHNMATGSFDWRVNMSEFVDEPSWIAPFLRVVLFGGLFATFLNTRGLVENQRLWARLMLTSLLVLFTSPLGWLHYLMLPVMLLPGLFEFSRSRALWVFFVIFAIGFSLPVYEVFTDYWQTFIFQVAFYVALTLILLGIVFRLTFAPRPQKA